MRAIFVFFCLLSINIVSCTMTKNVHLNAIGEEECQVLDAKIKEVNITRRDNHEEMLEIPSVRSLSKALRANRFFWALTWNISLLGLVFHFFRRNQLHKG